MEASISLKNLTVSGTNGRPHFSNLSFGVEKGSATILLGGNGAGKSLLLKSIAGLLPSNDGSIYVHGLDIRTRGEQARSLIGYLPQDDSLDDRLSLLDNLIFHGLLHGQSRGVARRRSRERLSRFKLGALENRYPPVLSSGQRRLAALARALVTDPPVLLLDEPTRSLDQETRDRIWHDLDNRDPGQTVLIATQDLIEGERFAGRIMALDAGQVVLDGTLDKIVEKGETFHHFGLMFAQEPPSEFLEALRRNPFIIDSGMVGHELRFTSPRRKAFLEVVALAAPHLPENFTADLVRLSNVMAAMGVHEENA